ncbi:hypothetical protein GAY28_01525 [Azospirillum brasilense]|nr:hypothetical protein [Azospirillum brasilense]
MRVTHQMLDHIADLEKLMSAAAQGYRETILPQDVTVPAGVPRRLHADWRAAYELGFVDGVVASVPEGFICFDDD